MKCVLAWWHGAESVRGVEALHDAGDKHNFSGIPSRAGDERQLQRLYASRTCHAPLIILTAHMSQLRMNILKTKK
jgi:hypothetical protein